MSAELLRDAAKVLRRLADNTWHGPWEACVTGDTQLGDLVVIQKDDDGFAVTDSLPPSTAEYIATMGPDVGLALADWLDKEAYFGDMGDEWASPHATTVARLILGREAPS